MIRLSLLAVLLAAWATPGSAQEFKSYADARKAVESGETLTLYVGVPVPAGVTGKYYHAAGFVELEAGVYYCRFEGGRPAMSRIVEASPVSGTATAVESAPRSGGLAQMKAEVQARAGRCYHIGGSLGAGNREGCGMSSSSPEAAIRASCYYGQYPILEIGVARGRDGWYACIHYAR